MPRITVARDVLAQGEPFYEDGVVAGWSSSPGFLVTSDDVEGAAAALHAAGQRFYRIDDHGRELDESQMYAADYTPNFVSEVHLTDIGLVLYADTKGDLAREMGEAMIRVLVEELSARGVGAHIAAMPFHFDPGDQIWSPPPS